jgi:hypothetical protein
MPQPLLHRSDIIPIFEQVGGERMAALRIEKRFAQFSWMAKGMSMRSSPSRNPAGPEFIEVLPTKKHWLLFIDYWLFVIFEDWFTPIANRK